MNNFTRLFLVLTLFSLAALPAAAADPEPQLPSTPPPPAVSHPTPLQAPNLDQVNQQRPTTPMMAEIKAAQEQGEAQVAELSARAANTPDRMANRAIQQEISQVKQQVQMDILHIQVRYARAEGNEDLARKIEADINAILNPPAPVAPAEPRPVPNNQN